MEGGVVAEKEAVRSALSRVQAFLLHSWAETQARMISRLHLPSPQITGLVFSFPDCQPHLVFQRVSS
ncbi:hypothetical protein TIFTF001_044114 [Ficus carica]|uniref:Uncharacterized protein n=1 Tax=Ficus carica TaxID=3494 RepID=A0AA88CS50_FICCA|nr:hypothetical protein TIFTF001_044114 [Ficus carica]